MITVRNVTKADAVAFWDLRLEGLRLNPEAFSASYEESLLVTAEGVLERISESEDQFVVGAFQEDGKLVGVAGFRREKTLKLKHKGMIWGVYVSAAHRNQGIAKQLMQTIIQRVEQLEGLRMILLTTGATNAASKKLYHTLGFKTFGVEPQSMFVNGEFLDEEFMVLELVSGQS